MMSHAALANLVNRIPEEILFNLLAGELGEPSVALEEAKALFFRQLTAGEPVEGDSPERAAEKVACANEAADAYCGSDAAPDWDEVRNYLGLDFSFQYTATQAVSHMADFLLAIDASLSGEELDNEYNPDGEGEHPLMTRHQWRTAVANEETLVGYWDWVSYQLANEITGLRSPPFAAA
jgi:hypothetical protein